MRCGRDEDCLPSKQKKNGKQTFMALVRPVSDPKDPENPKEWSAVPGFDLSPFEGEGDTLALGTATAKRPTPAAQPRSDEPDQLTDKPAAAAADQLSAEERDVVACEVGLDAGECAANEVCAPPNNRSRDSIQCCLESSWCC